MPPPTTGSTGPTLSTWGVAAARLHLFEQEREGALPATVVGLPGDGIDAQAQDVTGNRARTPIGVSAVVDAHRPA